MQHAKLVMRLFVAALLVAALRVQGQGADRKVLSLSSLTDCSMNARWVGLWQKRPEGGMLHCGSSDFLVLTPTNLFGHVRVQTPEQALEYVRFFSSAEHYNYFDLGGMVEIIPASKPAADNDGFNVVSPEVFSKWKLPSAQ